MDIKPRTRRLAVLLLAIPLPACSTLETAADRARDFAAAHPIVTAVAGGAVAGSIAATIVANQHHHHPIADVPHHIVCEPGVTACGSAP
jgi:hypothetical protein